MKNAHWEANAVLYFCLGGLNKVVHPEGEDLLVRAHRQVLTFLAETVDQRNITNR